MPIRIIPEGRSYTAEVTPPDSGEVPWRTPYPMEVFELVKALKSLGCEKRSIDAAFEAAWQQTYRQWADEIAPGLLAALDGNRKVPQQDPFSEAWLAYSLYYYEKLLSTEDILKTADAINHAIPTGDEVAWAFLRLRKRGWLEVQRDMYGLTPEGRRTIDIIVTRANFQRLKEWFSVHPPPGDE